jgi:hypothetical protein
MSKERKINLEELKDLVDTGIHPIIHYNSKLSECDFCCGISGDLLTQCDHYVIVENYLSVKNLVEVRMITNSNKYNNIRANSKQFSLLKNIGIGYYTERTFVISFDCLGTTTYFGYFKFL